MACDADARQTYALYVPSHYTPEKAWKLILAFDAGGRGQTGVERFQAAAEDYGYIVAGSNNSRNGPIDVSLAAAEAMGWVDVLKKYTIDSKHIYTTGQSGGARVAIAVALNTGKVAGVIASSAGFPVSGDGVVSAPFPIYGTAGTEDFNYLEMRTLDDQLTSPHHVEIFVGVHSWLSAELAMRAVEWMEVQAMKSRISPTNLMLAKEIFDKRVAEAEGMKDDFDRVRALNSIGIDFQDLDMKDVTKVQVEAAALMNKVSVKEELRADVAIRKLEENTTDELYDEIRAYARQQTGIGPIADAVHELLKESKAETDTAKRRMARRILAGLSPATRGAIDDEEYQKLLDEVRPRGVRPPA